MGSSKPKHAKKKAPLAALSAALGPKGGDGGEGRAKRGRARDVYSAIGYDALFKDGVCLVEPGLYSQTIAFDDISYQSASSEAQDAVCRKMRQMLNALDTDSCLQVTMVNRPLHENEIGNRRFFGEDDPAVAPFAREYNKILNDKMLEGVSNIERSRYLTFCVGAPDARRALPKLSQARGTAADALESMRASTRVLDGGERLRLVHSVLRPEKRALEVDWDALKRCRDLTTKDLVCPNLMDFKPQGRHDCFTADGVWFRALSLRSFESSLSDRCLADMIDLPVPLVVTLHVQPLDPNWSIGFVNKRLNWIDKEVVESQMNAVKKGYDYSLIPAELKYTREEAQDMFNLLKDKDQHLFRYTGLVLTYAQTLDELEEHTSQLVSVAKGNGIELACLDYRQREGLNSSLPLGKNHVDQSRYMLTDEVAVQSPFATIQLNQPGGGYYGQNRHSRDLVLLNRRRLASRNGIDCGTPGSGKSFGVKREILNTRLAYPRDEIYGLDPANEYGNLFEALGGRCVQLSPDSDCCLNPLGTTDVAERSERMQTAMKTEALMALACASLSDTGERPSDAERSVISRCHELALAHARSCGRPVVLEDVYDQLLSQPEPEARAVALRLERYVHGALSIFNRQSNVAFDGQMTCFSFRDLPENMRAFAMIAVLEAVRNRMYSNYERGVTTWLYVDEVQSMFAHPAVIDYFSRFTAEGRKFNLIFTGITQNVSYLLDHPQGRNIILNSDYLMLHKQSFTDREKWRELLGLSEQELGYIDDSVKPGEGLLVAGAVRVPIVDDFPKGALYDLFNTKPDEIAQIKRRAHEDKSHGAHAS